MLDDKETWYLYFDAEDYEFIRRKFPELHKLFENYVDKRSDVIRLAVTDKSCDYLDTKVMVAYSRTAAHKDSGEPSEDDVKLEKIWDKARASRNRCFFCHKKGMYSYEKESC